jgi:hypothetical protein
MLRSEPITLVTLQTGQDEAGDLAAETGVGGSEEGGEGAAGQVEAREAVLDWRKQHTTRARVYTTIQDVLEQLPRAYTKEIYVQKCEAVFQHVFESYRGQGQSLYSA